MPRVSISPVIRYLRRVVHGWPAVELTDADLLARFVASRDSPGASANRH